MILVVLLLGGAGCMPTDDPATLPYYRTADWTPEWIEPERYREILQSVTSDAEELKEYLKTEG